MPKYLIEHEIPGAGKLSASELHGVSQTSRGVLHRLGPHIQWLQSYVTGDKVYCEGMIRKIIDPTTAEKH